MTESNVSDGEIEAGKAWFDENFNGCPDTETLVEGILSAAAKVRAIREGDGEVREAALNEAATVAAQFIDGRLYKPKFPACSYHAGEIADAIRALASVPATGGEKE